MLETRPPAPGEYVDPQPAAVDTAADDEIIRLRTALHQQRAEAMRERTAMSEAALVLIALRVSEEDAAERIQAILRTAKPTGDPPETEAHVWWRRVRPAPAGEAVIAKGDELAVADLDRVAQIIGWEAVERLNVGLPWSVVEASDES